MIKRVCATCLYKGIGLHDVMVTFVPLETFTIRNVKCGLCMLTVTSVMRISYTAEVTLNSFDLGVCGFHTENRAMV